MNKFIGMLLVVLTMSGCGTISTPSGPVPALFVQRGVQLEVFNYCTKGEAMLYPTHSRPHESGVIALGGNGRGKTPNQSAIALPPGGPTPVALAPPFLVYNRYVTATVVFVQGDAIGTVSRSFPIDRDNTYPVQWVIGGDRGHGGGRYLEVDRCPQAFTKRR